MKKIYMRAKNDCYTCCLAMVLGLEYEQVPRFFDDEDTPLGEGYHKSVETFLNSIGEQLVVATCTEDLMQHLKGLVIVSGPSYTPEYAAKGVAHAVVYLNGKLWCDPKSPEPSAFIVPDQIDLLVSILGEFHEPN